MFPEGDDEGMAFAADAAPTVGGPTRKAPEVTGAEAGRRQALLLPANDSRSWWTAAERGLPVPAGRFGALLGKALGAPCRLHVAPLITLEPGESKVTPLIALNAPGRFRPILCV